MMEELRKSAAKAPIRRRDVAEMESRAGLHVDAVNK